jgi:CRISPR/Cas system CMR subunit Cmr6 (Cas7 group RAMP superfamily)
LDILYEMRGCRMSFNKKLTELKNKITEKNQKESTEQARWKKKYDKIINIAEQIFDAGYDERLEFFISNADILKFCKVEHYQSRGSNLSFRIYRKDSGDAGKTIFEEKMSFSGNFPVEFDSYTEYLLDHIESQISHPGFIQELIDNI